MFGEKKLGICTMSMGFKVKPRLFALVFHFNSFNTKPVILLVILLNSNLKVSER